MDDELRQALERIRLCDEEEAAELAELIERLSLWAGVFADAELRVNARKHLRRGVIRYARQIKTPPAGTDDIGDYKKSMKTKE